MKGAQSFCTSIGTISIPTDGPNRLCTHEAYIQAAGRMHVVEHARTCTHERRVYSNLHTEKKHQKTMVHRVCVTCNVHYAPGQGLTEFKPFHHSSTLPCNHSLPASMPQAPHQAFPHIYGKKHLEHRVHITKPSSPFSSTMPERIYINACSCLWKDCCVLNGVEALICQTLLH